MAQQTNYVAASEYSSLGIPTATDDQVSQASNIVDAYIERPEGLLYAADANGTPLYMVRKEVQSTRTLTSALAQGANITASMTAGPLLQSGTSVVLNRAGSTAEICKIQSVTNANTVVLAFVTNAHLLSETVEFGLAIDEQITLPINRTYATVRKGPIARLVSVQGRVTYSRRGNWERNAAMQDFGVLATISAFAGAPVWQDVYVPDSNIDVSTGNIWCPIGLLMIPYTEVKISYIAGYETQGLPKQIKQATANILRAINESPASATVKTFKAGATQMERFLDSVIDAETRALLSSYTARQYG